MPQNQPRLYIVCIREDVDQGTFAWPEPLGVPPEIDRFLDDRAAQPEETDAFIRSFPLLAFSGTSRCCSELVEVLASSLGYDIMLPC